MPKLNVNFLKKALLPLSRIQKLILWAPVFTIMLGSFISYYTYIHLKQRDDYIEKYNFSQTAREELVKIDLLLTNSILKIQSYENNLESRPSNYTKDSTYLALALQHTLFQRLSVYRDDSDLKSKSRKKTNLPEDKVKLIMRLNTVNSILPDSNNSYIKSEIIYNAIQDLKKSSGYISTVLYEAPNTNMPRLSVILRSKFHNNIYFIFTTPLINLFSETNLNPKDSLIISSKSHPNSWILKTDSRKNKSLVVFQENQKIQSKYKLIFTNSLPQSNIDVTFQFNFTPIGAEIIEPENIAGIMGVLLTLVIAYLFYNLITQNKYANNMIISKTIDLEKTAHDLQEALDSKAHFFGKISHEIRTPLNLIMGMIDLSREITTDKNVQAYLKTMQTSGEHLLSMLDDLIELAKAEKNEMTFQERNIYLPQFLGDVVKLISQDCRTKGLKLYVEFDKNMPANITADPNRLRQILLNLLRNANKYTQEGYIKLSVSAIDSFTTNKVKLKFEIQDSGIGIPTDKLSRVFDAFFQVENSKLYSQGGVGLGLSIVKDIVKKMNGTVTVNSIPSKGSIFTVSLEFEKADKTKWYEIFKIDTVQTGKNLELVVLSRNNFINDILQTLSSHPHIQNIIYLNDDLNLVFSEQYKNSIIVADSESISIDLDKLKNTFGKNLFIINDTQKIETSNASTQANFISNHPFLAYELLVAMGFSSRTKSRQEFQKKQSPLEQKSNSAPNITPPENLSVIIADDDLGNIELYKAYLAKVNWKIEYTYDGLAAWNVYQNSKPDLLILDVRMPHMDGFQLIEKIRTHEKTNKLGNVPIVLVTADILDYTSKTAKSFTNVTLLSKPLKKSLLMETIAKMIVPKQTDLHN
ncbi:MAG: hybrid sensor histidine kinase/response regulator [Pseudobdellovibrio sp.]